MIDIMIPGFKHLLIQNLVLDFNGTIALDGAVLNGVKEALEDLSRKVEVYVLTADSRGNVELCLSGYPCHVVIIPYSDQAVEKAQYVRKLGNHKTICIGNGRNDALMLKEAALGIAVLQREGAASEVLTAADLVVHDILDAFLLLAKPLRLIATLRS